MMPSNSLQMATLLSLILLNTNTTSHLETVRLQTNLVSMFLTAGRMPFYGSPHLHKVKYQPLVLLMPSSAIA
jgi:hypothetical protein